MTDTEPTADNFDGVACRDAFAKWMVSRGGVDARDYYIFEAGARWQRDRQATDQPPQGMTNR